MSSGGPRGFVGAIKKHRMALQALRICYRDLSKRVAMLEKFRGTAEPLLVDFLLDRAAKKRPRR